MKKLFILLACVVSLHSYAEPVRSSYRYVEAGLGPFPLPIPSFGLGFRNQVGYNGFDISLKASTLIAVTAVKGSLLYHYYPNPSCISQFYYGIGIGGGALFHDWDSLLGFVSPQFAVGKSYLTDTGGRRFFQMQVSWPTFASSRFSREEIEVLYMPLVVFSYGIGF